MPYSMSVFPMIIKIFLIIVSGMGKQLSFYGITESSFQDPPFTHHLPQTYFNRKRKKHTKQWTG